MVMQEVRMVLSRISSSLIPNASPADRNAWVDEKCTAFRNQRMRRIL